MQINLLVVNALDTGNTMQTEIRMIKVWKKWTRGCLCNIFKYQFYNFYWKTEELYTYFVIGDSVKHLFNLRGALCRAGYWPRGIQRIMTDCHKADIQQILVLWKCEHGLAQSQLPLQFILRISQIHTTLRSGYVASTEMNSMYLANPSFSQRSFHQFMVTKLPNHCRPNTSRKTLSILTFFSFFFFWSADAALKSYLMGNFVSNHHCHPKFIRYARCWGIH